MKTMRKTATAKVHKMATMSDRITTRIDARLKKNAVKIFDRLGLSEAEAIRLFYAQVELYKGIPFPLNIPNAETRAALEESRRDFDKLPTFKSFRAIREHTRT
jgi:DNA-damage-inducible protein J